MKYPEYATELVDLFNADQAEKKALGKAFFYESDELIKQKQKILKEKTLKRTQRMLEILAIIKEPSISNIGAEGAQAISVLALHDKLEVIKQVLNLFNELYQNHKDDTYYQAIPSMTDIVLILEHKPQYFGTQWFFDAKKEPFLPTVKDFDTVNERRSEYGIEPLRWPRSLAIPESEQPWLKKPLSGLIMREPTDKEREQSAGS